MSCIVAAGAGRPMHVLAGSVPSGLVLELPLPPDHCPWRLWRVTFEWLPGECLQHWRHATTYDVVAAGLVLAPSQNDLELENARLRAAVEQAHGLT